MSATAVTAAKAKDLEAFEAALNKRLGPVEELLAKLAAPASRAGMSPEEMLRQMTDGGRRSMAFGHDGASVTPGGRAKSLGWGEMWKGLYDLHSGVRPRDPEKLHKKLFGAVEEQGWGLVPVEQTKAALAEGSGVTGGYTVPPQFSNNLMQLAIEDSIVEPLATTVPMTGMTWTGPYLDQTTAQSAGRTAFTGGIVASWTSEAATRDETEPTFRQCELKAWELSFYTVASNNLLADNAVGLDALLTQLFSRAISWYCDYAFLQGNGVGKPSGVVNDPATIAVNRGTAARVRYVDVVTMYSRLLLQSAGSARWVAHQSIMPDLLQMHDSSGNQTTFGAGRELFTSIDQGAVKKPTWQILGAPLQFTEKVPSLGNKGDLGLYDFSKYLVGRRAEVEVAMSPHVKFLQNSSVWRVVVRLDGRPWLSGPVTLADGTFTVSPFVVLN